MVPCDSNTQDDVVMIHGDVADHSTIVTSDVMGCERTVECDTDMDEQMSSSSSSFDTTATQQVSPAVVRSPKRRKVCFPAEYVHDVYEIPSLSEYRKEETDPDDYSIWNALFYNDADYKRFRASEEKRHHKMISKKVQKMVQEKMQPSINQAVANGATLEDIEAMMPKTHEEMMSILGDDYKEKLPPAAFAAAFGEMDTKQQSLPPQHRTIRGTRSSIAVHRSEENSMSSAAAAVAALFAEEDEEGVEEPPLQKK